jgi:hypothetical protein
MGNAVFVMEATEPLPVKHGELPALRNSGWNDRDYVPSGTYNSVINFGEGDLGEGANTTEIQIATASGDFAMSSTVNFAYEAWIYRTSVRTGQPTIFGSGTNDSERISLRTDVAGSNVLTLAVAAADGTWFTSGTRGAVKGGTTGGTGSDYDSALGIENNRWYHVVVYTEGSPRDTIKVAVNGETWINAGNMSHNIADNEDYLSIGQWHSGTTAWAWCGFMDNIKIYYGYADNTYDPVREYMNARDNNYTQTANSALKLWLKADSTYGDTTFTDSSGRGQTIVPKGGVSHHIEDDRTANTTLYFDGYSMLRFPNIPEMAIGRNGDDYCIEAWVKPQQGNGFLFYSAGGTSYSGTTNNEGIRISVGSNGNAWDGTGTDYDWQIHSNEQVNNSDDHIYSGTQLIRNSWNHVCVQRFARLHSGYVQILINGVLVKLGSAAGRNLDGQSDMSIGGRLGNLTPTHSFVGWMDGIRITNGMPRYTSGIPADGQSPAKDYDDGRSSNVSSNTWATSSTRRYYGINTHTYLQTTQYSTDANTVLLIRGDDAQTANDGVNMYGENGFHLEFKEVGAGDERDYNNFGTGTRGFGSDTSATQEFADDTTLVLLRSRPNQANGSSQFVDETDQNILTNGDTPIHSTTKSVFSVDSNTANVSIASGGSGTY